ncbi:MAG: tRNA (N(6)-L-threonylcarbamoyladenosine(37)-C(2))-methylthiotransferase MtaB [Hyphomicrobiaceae bacterium]|nr:tRNA (N(6)-L-threonylcarbamoyladenosine(37)-C(2))-methylthiotransferase MtaB [Hyphomicrobiaceae bacterium]
MGCRLNAYEAEVMRAHARAAGLGDTIIVNTCAVTGEAVRQATQSIRRLKRERPGATVIVTGCAAQLDPLRFADMAEVDHVVGNAEKMQAGTFIALVKRPATAEGALPRVAVGDIMRVRETALHLVDGFTGRARATVEIQNGCDHRCTFCIIPFARGPSRSLPPDAIVSRVRDHVRAGYAEVVLTGVDITSYGGELGASKAEPGAELRADITLGQLVRRILDEVPQLSRLRLSSIDQIEADEALVSAITDHSRLMPHLHLSLQSGDDLILKRMKRRHLRDDAVRFCERIRRLRPDVVFGADLIAGFPTETEAQFQNSLDLIDACGITYVHAFPFSPRAGTPASRMPQTGRAVAKERAARLRAAGDRRLAGHLASLIGSRQSIVVEAGSMGRTPQYTEVRFDPGAFPSGPPAHGSVVELFITGVVGRALSGVPV